MTYNELDPFAARWIRNLEAAGHIAAGSIDTRSITEIQPNEIDTSQFHAFAGIGVWSHALRVAGYHDAWNVWTGSCPCQPFSQAGRRAAKSDARHLWPEWFRLIRKRRPRVVVGERDGHLEARRLGDSGREGPQGLGGDGDGGNQPGWLSEEQARSTRSPGPTNGHWASVEWLPCRDGKWRPTQPGLQPLAHGATQRVGRLRAYGNAIEVRTATAFLQALKPQVEDFLRAP